MCLAAHIQHAGQHKSLANCGHSRMPGPGRDDKLDNDVYGLRDSSEPTLRSLIPEAFEKEGGSMLFEDPNLEGWHGGFGARR